MFFNKEEVNKPVENKVEEPLVEISKEKRTELMERAIALQSE